MNYKEYLKGFIGKRGKAFGTSASYVFSYDNIRVGGYECTITEIHDDFIICRSILPDIGSFYQAIPFSSLLIEGNDKIAKCSDILK